MAVVSGYWGTMTSESNKALQAAQGYAELGMPDEAWDELQEVPADVRETRDCMHLETMILLKLKHWEEALAASRRLCDMEPGRPSGYIHGAFCLHELGRTHEARDLLLEGPDTLLKVSIYYYNLGCYEAHLGKLAEAERLVRQSFLLDENLRSVAAEDPDLEQIWPALQ